MNQCSAHLHPLWRIVAVVVPILLGIAWALHLEQQRSVASPEEVTRVADTSLCAKTILALEKPRSSPMYNPVPAWTNGDLNLVMADCAIRQSAEDQREAIK